MSSFINGCVPYLLPSLFLGLNEALVKLVKMFFTSEGLLILEKIKL